VVLGMEVFQLVMILGMKVVLHHRVLFLVVATQVFVFVLVFDLEFLGSFPEQDIRELTDVF